MHMEIVTIFHAALLVTNSAPMIQIITANVNVLKRELATNVSHVHLVSEIS